MIRILLSFFCVTFLLVNVSYAGIQDSIGVTKIGTQLHVRYLVSPGETVYGISSRYGVSVADLMEINPELENGLKVGQIINIPYYPEAVQKYQARQQMKTDDNLVIHKVQAGETLYSLAKRYNTTVEQLQKWNNLDIKAGQELIVGKKDQQQTAQNNQTTQQQQQTANNNQQQTTNNSQQQNQTQQQQTAQNNQTTQQQQQQQQQTANNNQQQQTQQQQNQQQTAQNNQTTQPQTTAPKTTAPTDNAVTLGYEPYPFDPNKKQVLVIPFDPYLYFSDADDEIAARSNIVRTKVRQVFRRRLNALIDARGYETIHLLGGDVKDSVADLNIIYSSVNYSYMSEVKNEQLEALDLQKQQQQRQTKQNPKEWLEKQKDKVTGNTDKYDMPDEHEKYFGVTIKDMKVIDYFNKKYDIDYYIFITQFEVKTNYEHCLDRAALNYERTFTTHYCIFDNKANRIAGEKFRTHYNSNTNLIMQIVADNMPNVVQRILAALPPPNAPSPAEANK